MTMRPKKVHAPPVQEIVWHGEQIDLTRLPAQICWPGEPAPHLTWPLVVTRPPDDQTGDETNVGVYRMQVIGRDRAIMRWLAHRGGARHHHQWKAQGRDMPVAVAIGADPATILSAVLPLPETLSEFRFAGLIRGERLGLSPCITVPLMVPSDAEIIIEGLVSPDETAPEGPFGDHTGYYNAVEDFPVMRVTAITMGRTPAGPPTSPRASAKCSTSCSCRWSESSFRRSSIFGCHPRPAPTGSRLRRSTSATRARPAASCSLYSRCCRSSPIPNS
jgi:4-hydroxy-3-polyprenylbenzoate decarboxylase